MLYVITLPEEATADLIFNDREVRELQRQCLHHNIFPIFIGHCLGGDPAAVHAVLKPIMDTCMSQFLEMSFSEVKQIVDAIPAGLRMTLEPIEAPLAREYLTRVAVYCIAAEIQKKYSPVAAVVQARPKDSEVLVTCPELRDLFDNDGLLELNDDFILFDGGIQYGDYFLHYHQFLRRGFSSNPNFDFLGRFAQYRLKMGNQNSFKIAIDHRRIMKFEDYRQVFELDTWYGPKFDHGRLDDPNSFGLTVVGRMYPSYLDSHPLVKTEFFWKTNEAEFIKTVEIEELSCPSKPNENCHINRYVHAERDMQNKIFRHFDGAAKVYTHGDYHQRLAQTMPNNMRPNNYIKLFRIDGSIDLKDWLSLVSMFYKGNEMVIEYFDPELFNKEFRPIRERIRDATR